jgi:hypothetical protein
LANFGPPILDTPSQSIIKTIGSKILSLLDFNSLSPRCYFYFAVIYSLYNINHKVVI